VNNPKHVVVMSFVTSGILIGANDLLQKKFPSYKQVGGVFAVYLMLAVAVEFAPDVSAGFALLVLVTVFLETFGSLSKELKTLLSASSSAAGRGGGFSSPATAGRGGGGGGMGAG